GERGDCLAGYARAGLCQDARTCWNQGNGNGGRMKRIVLVTGTRSRYPEVDKTVRSRLDSYEKDGVVVMHGGARGAATGAALWARDCGVQERALPAAWKTGKQARPARNATRASLVVALQGEGYEVHAEAFPAQDPRGTWDCVRRLRAAGIEPTITEV